MIQYKEFDLTGGDISEMVSLLQTSLKGTDSIDHFLWKHSRNPFGKSVGILAYDQQKLIGLRVFMRWQFAGENTLLHAVRPVDSIIHPEYRNKGYFKTMTLAALEKKPANTHLVFNTPNQNSLTPYLKMGWQRFSTTQSFVVALHFPLIEKAAKVSSITCEDLPDDMVNHHNGLYSTSKNKAFLTWRYEHRKYFKKRISHGSYSCIIIYRIEKKKGLNLLILLEVLGDSIFHSRAIAALLRHHRSFVLHFLTESGISFKPHLVLSRTQPVIVFRDDVLQCEKSIRFSSGDLEGVL